MKASQCSIGACAGGQTGEPPQARRFSSSHKHFRHLNHRQESLAAMSDLVHTFHSISYLYTLIVKDNTHQFSRKKLPQNPEVEKSAYSRANNDQY